MTHRGGRDALGRRRGIGEDERQVEMARPAAQYGRSNFVKLVTLRKGNHPGEAQVSRGQRKALYRKREGLLRGRPKWKQR